MDVDKANPLDLTLDELIALNRKQNEKAEEEKLDTLSMKSFAFSINSKRSKVDSYKRPSIEIGGENDSSIEMQIENHLRKIPGFGSKPIHHRLGYMNSFKRRQISPAQKILNKAKMQFWKKTPTVQSVPNPRIHVQNLSAISQPFVSPLTRNSVMKFNSMNKTIIKTPLNSSRSIITRASSTPAFRHSILRCLTPSIQQKLSQLEPSAAFDPDILESFVAVPQCTMVPTDKRFSTYI